jgi:hypothetical protein
MNTARLCCCEPGSVEECPVSSCPCASSYSVSNIAVNYGYQNNSSPPVCANCGQSGCYKRDWSITVSGVQLGPLVVTRGGGSGEQLPCCYYGEGEMRITYSVSFTESRHCSGARNISYPTQSFTGTIDVPMSLSVYCRNTATIAGCGRNLGVARSYQHKLQICNWPIECSDVLIAGTIDAITNECTAGVTCDDGDNCEFGPFSLWCGGANITYISRYQCLDTLLPSDSACQGFYQGGPLCGDGIDPFLLDRVANNGPFACFLREECDQGVADPCDQAMGTVGAFLPTIAHGNTPSVLADLKSFCASVDQSISTPCSTVDIIQSGCGPGIPWTYA